MDYLLYGQMLVSLMFWRLTNRMIYTFLCHSLAIHQLLTTWIPIPIWGSCNWNGLSYIWALMVNGNNCFFCDVLMYTCLRCNGALTKPPLKFGCGAINEPGIPRRCNYIFMSHIKSYIFHLPRDCCWMVFQLPCCMVYWRLKTHADKINANTPFHSLASGRFQFDFG